VKSGNVDGRWNLVLVSGAPSPCGHGIQRNPPDRSHPRRPVTAPPARRALARPRLSPRTEINGSKITSRRDRPKVCDTTGTISTARLVVERTAQREAPCRGECFIR
jgi:hypothetical protein